MFFSETMHVNSANTMTIALMFSLNNTHFCTGCLLQIPEVYYNDLGNTWCFIRHSWFSGGHNIYVSLPEGFDSFKVRDMQPRLLYDIRSDPYGDLTSAPVRLTQQHLLQLRVCRKLTISVNPQSWIPCKTAGVRIISSLSQMSWTVLNDICFIE